MRNKKFEPQKTYIGKFIYFFAFHIIQLIIKKPRILGKKNIDETKPNIFVANHLGYFSPVILRVYSGINFIPWVAHQITDNSTCPDYLEKDFIRPTLRIPPPFSKWISLIIGKICVSVMKYIEAIPVYSKSKKILETISLSVSELKKGNQLLIFPEIANNIEKEILQKFNTGFIFIAKVFFTETYQKVNFHPVWVDKASNTITFGKKITFNPYNLYSAEKERIILILYKKISQGLLENNKDKVAS